MSEQLPPPPHPKLAGPRPPRTRIPRVFNIWGTIAYSACAAAAFFFMIALAFGIYPPWYVMLPCLFYVFMSAGIIAFGRMESNKDARSFIQALRSDENQRAMRKMN
jgi:hypothetical protein